MIGGNSVKNMATEETVFNQLFQKHTFEIIFFIRKFLLKLRLIKLQTQINDDVFINIFVQAFCILK